MNVIIGSKKRLVLEDILELSMVQCDLIKLDEGNLERLDAAFRLFPEETFSQDCKIGTVHNHDFSAEIRRAALIIRLHSLLNGRSPVRGTIIRLIADLLNRGITPQFSSFEKAGNELVAFLSGEGFATLSNNQVISASDALLSIGWTPQVLTTLEAAAFVKHPFLLLGLASVVIGGANRLADCVDSVAALSVEAKGAMADGFDSTLFETCRQHRGQINSAANLRLLLEGSKRINSVQSLDPSFTAFHNIPQIHGPSQDTILNVIKGIEIELNSTETAPLNPSNGYTFDATQSRLLLENVGNALLALLISSQNRIKSLTGGEVHIVYVNDDILKPLHFLRDLADSLAKELSTAHYVLCTIERENALKHPDSNKWALNEDKNVDRKAGKQINENELSPADREKVEAKRRAKAEKAAAKAAAKEQRKGAIVLGVGTTAIRAIVSNVLVLNPDELPPLNSLDYYRNLLPLIDPFRQVQEALFTQFRKIIDQLLTGGRRKPKIPKGTRDYTPEQMRIREQVFASIKKVFKRHGGVEIDTPVFELKEVLTGKYGEDSKLIYDLADQGGELLALRYDLTVPFARFLALNSVGNIKRYHIAKVYRRDQPQLNRGRYREFYQCDFDVAGHYSPMVPDAEVITVAVEILSDLPIGKFVIKLSHRKLLDAIFDICGVPKDKFRPICSAVDKLDKLSWEEVKEEMVNEKGLPAPIADEIAKFVLKVGKPLELWTQLMNDKAFGDHQIANEAMSELKALFDYLKAMQSLDFVSFDLSLARGLDYYTGVIYEAVLIDGVAQVGSIAAGGRYDQLVGMFSPAGIQTPCVGVSIGVERVFTIMEKKAESLNLLQRANVQVLVASIGNDLILERMRVAQLLWSNNISAEYSHLPSPKFKKQLDEALDRGIPFMVIIGEDEIKRGVVKVKDMKKHNDGDETPLEGLIQTLLAAGCRKLNLGTDEDFIQAMKDSINFK